MRYKECGEQLRAVQSAASLAVSARLEKGEIMLFQIDRFDLNIFNVPVVELPAGVTLGISVDLDAPTEEQPLRSDAARWGCLATNPYYDGDADALLLQAVREACAKLAPSM